jgi:type II secretory pathway component PulM
VKDRLRRLRAALPLPRLTQALRRLGPRDRRAALALAVLLGLLLLRYGLLGPLGDFAAAAAGREAEQRQLWQYLQRTEAQARAAAGRHDPTGSGGQSLLTRVSATSRDAGPKPARLQPEGSGGVSVWFEAVEFNQLLGWLDRLHEQGIGIRQLSIDRRETAGRVDARLLLEG